jgi:hypothetical protein
MQQKSKLTAMAYRLSQLNTAIANAQAVGIPTQEYELATADQDRKIQALLATYFGSSPSQ